MGKRGRKRGGRYSCKRKDNNKASENSAPTSSQPAAAAAAGGRKSKSSRRRIRIGRTCRVLRPRPVQRTRPVSQVIRTPIQRASPAPPKYPGYAGDVNALPPLENVGKILECPVCLEVPLPPIFTCARGHSICGGCKDKVADCGLCNMKYGTARNFTAEALINGSTFKCRHDGCEEVVRGDQMVDHLKVCKHSTEAKAKSEANEGPAAAAAAAVAQHRKPKTGPAAAAVDKKNSSGPSSGRHGRAHDLLRQRLLSRLRHRNPKRKSTGRKSTPASRSRSRSRQGPRRSLRLIEKAKAKNRRAESKSRSRNPTPKSKRSHNCSRRCYRSRSRSSSSSSSSGSES